MSRLNYAWRMSFEIFALLERPVHRTSSNSRRLVSRQRCPLSFVLGEDECNKCQNRNESLRFFSLTRFWNPSAELIPVSFPCGFFSTFFLVSYYFSTFFHTNS